MLAMTLKTAPELLYENSSNRPFSTILSGIETLKGELKKVLRLENEFKRRIRVRHLIFWNNNNKSPLMNKEEMPLLFAEDPIEKWKAAPNWQRLLSNKHNSREFAKKYGCRVPGRYWRGKEYQTIDFDGLPHNYVIRPTTGHSSCMVFLMQGNLNLLDGLSYSKEEILSKLSMASSQNPQLEFLFEEFLSTDKGEFKIHDDYKVYTFNGEVACIRVINRRGPSEGTYVYYDEDWNVMPSIRGKDKYSEGVYQPPPACLNEMLSFAKTLSKAYEIFVRVDLYATPLGAVFGEFAPTPYVGDGYTNAGSKFLIKLWDTHCKGLI